MKQTIPERKDNPAHSSKIRNNSMNGFKNDMDDEKSLKGKGATGACSGFCVNTFSQKWPSRR
ncbi:hypothetical protein ACGI06_23020, partial [Escherichia coli]